jgi:hypothetical protein
MAVFSLLINNICLAVSPWVTIMLTTAQTLRPVPQGHQEPSQVNQKPPLDSYSGAPHQFLHLHPALASWRNPASASALRP